MDFDEFRDFGNASIEFLINYFKTIRERNVLSSLGPRAIINQLPLEIPEQPEHWRDILADLENIILPGLTHWQSPYFNAYFPSSSSAGSIIGEMLIAGIGVLGFSWIPTIQTAEIVETVNILLLEEDFLKCQQIHIYNHGSSRRN